jgi:Pyruvate/2-oxoacid:ferredoxin oxidoreductase delta subunit
MPAATIFYMTGTGNTWRAATTISDTLADRGWSVQALELRKGAGIPTGDFADDLLVLCFPVFAFGMPRFVRPFLRGIRGRGRAAAVFATWGGAGTASLWQAAGFLRCRGFRVAATGGAAYPFNWTQMLAPTDKSTSRSMTNDGVVEARRFADALPESVAGGGTAVRRTAAGAVLGGAIVSWLYSVVGRFALGALFAADERCTACGECERDCPARAIVMAGQGEKRRPMWLTRCAGCNRCVNMCPEAAIQSSPTRAIVHLAANAVLIVLSIVGLSRLSALAALPLYLAVPAWIVLIVLLVVYLTRLQLWALEPLLFALEGLPAGRRRIGRSWTARFGRNSCEGFSAGTGAGNGPVGSGAPAGNVSALKRSATGSRTSRRRPS